MFNDIIKYINDVESTDVSYVKVSDGNKKLIVSFASNGKPMKNFFQYKESLTKLKYEQNNFDMLYLRDQNKWYLGGLNGIGKNIDDTLFFLKKEFSKYDKVLCMGNSSGGYASLLFGSLLNVNQVIAVDAQTDLQYVKNKIKNSQLVRRANKYPVTWNKYNKIVNILNDNVLYKVFYSGVNRANLSAMRNEVLHGDYHYDQIKHWSSVNKFKEKETFFTLTKKFLEEV